MPVGRKHRRTALFASALAVVMVVGGCGNDSDTAGDSGAGPSTGGNGALVIDGTEVADGALYQAAKQEGKFTFYATISDARASALIKAFKEQTGVDADIVRLSGGPMSVRVLNELKAGKLGADVVQQTDIGLVLQENTAGAFQPYCPPGFKDIPAELKEASCNYWVHSFTPYAIGYNSALVKADEAPKTWEALLDPKWKGKIGWAYIGAGGSSWGRDFFLRDKFGVKYWNDLAALSPLITSGSGVVTDKIATGEIALGAVGPGTHAAAAAKGAPLGLVMPTDGVPVLGVYVGLGKQASKPNAAKLFLNWLSTAPGQKAVVETTSDYAVLPSAPAPNFNGQPMPAAKDANLVYVEAKPTFQSEQANWTKEWYTIFNYSAK